MFCPVTLHSRLYSRDESRTGSVNLATNSYDDERTVVSRNRIATSGNTDTGTAIGSKANRAPLTGHNFLLRHVARKRRTAEHVVSWRLSVVFEDIGLTREITRVRQTLWLQRQNLWTVMGKLEGKTVKLVSVGSHIEGEIRLHFL